MKKKWVIGITAVTLAAATAIGSTLAYFTATTQQMKNSFTVAAPNGITGQLREQNWDGYDFNQLSDHTKDPNGAPDGSQVNPNADPNKTYGFNQAKDVLPGDTVQKNPILMNTTNWDFSQNKGLGGLATNKVGVDVYMAMKVTYSDKFKQNSEVLSYKGKAGINPEWVKYTTLSDGSEIYVWYGGSTAPATIASGGKTDALFDSVQVDSGITQPADLQDFDIVLQGSAIQARNVPAKDINSRLAGLLPIK